MNKNCLRKRDKVVMRSIFLIAIVSAAALACRAQTNIEHIKITKIESSDDYFFLRGKRKKSGEKILIVSKKYDRIGECHEVQKGKVYLLELEQFLDSETLEHLPAKPPGTLILREDGYIIWDGKSALPLRAKNIQGLCLLP